MGGSMFKSEKPFGAQVTGTYHKMSPAQQSVVNKKLNLSKPKDGK